jgi:shikimate kinase
LARTRNDKKRPLLQGDNPEEILTKLVHERAPLYEEISDYRFISDDQSVKSLVQKIVKQLRADKVIN